MNINRRLFYRIRTRTTDGDSGILESKLKTPLKYGKWHKVWIFFQERLKELLIQNKREILFKVLDLYCKNRKWRELDLII